MNSTENENKDFETKIEIPVEQKSEDPLIKFIPDWCNPFKNMSPIVRFFAKIFLRARCKKNCPFLCPKPRKWFSNAKEST